MSIDVTLVAHAHPHPLDEVSKAVRLLSRFAVAYPDGVGGTWDPGRELDFFPSMRERMSAVKLLAIILAAYLGLVIAFECLVVIMGQEASGARRPAG